MNINPIRTDADHAAALKEIDRLWNAELGTEDGDRLDILVTLVEKYEDTRWPIKETNWDPVDVLKYAIKEMGHTQAELADVLKSRPRASEILSRERSLTLEMIRAISEEWKIPSELLIKPYKVGVAA
jgi:HTH-type transcriptional regulator / antitoxin HigA